MAETQVIDSGLVVLADHPASAELRQPRMRCFQYDLTRIL